MITKWKNLINDHCPHCGTKLEINPICGKRTCPKPGCFFTMSKQTRDQIVNRYERKA